MTLCSWQNVKSKNYPSSHLSLSPVNIWLNIESFSLQYDLLGWLCGWRDVKIQELTACQKAMTYKSFVEKFTVIALGVQKWEGSSRLKWAGNRINKLKGVKLKDVTQTQQQRPESPMVILTWHTNKCKVHKFHQMYILFVAVFCASFECWLAPLSVDFGQESMVIYTPIDSMFNQYALLLANSHNRQGTVKVSPGERMLQPLM